MSQIHACEQRSEEWYRLRLGLPTASEFHTVMAKGRDGGPSVTRRTYLYKLAGERLTGEPAENYSNAYMQRGQAMESPAREMYAFLNDADPVLVGLITNDLAGCSPDSLIGDDGVLEIKTKAAHLHIEAVLAGKFPAEHRAQCQGQLWVAEREWVDLAIYWPRLPLHVVRAYRDEPYIKEIERAVRAFRSELDDIVGRVQARGAVAA